MSTTEAFDRRLAGWLDSDAAGRVPDHLTELLVVTRATRQRPAWSSLERWLPMTSVASARLATPRLMVPLLVVLVLLVAALTAFVLVQTGRPTLPPLGDAANERIVYVDGTSIHSVAADGHDARVVATLSEPPGNPTISPDGQLVAFTAEGNRIDILNLAAGTGSAPIAVTAPGMSEYGAAAWSPAGDRIAFVAADARSDHVFVADADGTDVHEVAADMIGAGHFVGWAGFSPDGTLLGFAEASSDVTGRLVVVAPDGSGARPLDSNLVDMDGVGTVAWSPDPATARLLYRAYGGPTYYYDLRTNDDVYVAIGFWPSWSPTGDRISFWNEGTKVIDTPGSSASVGTPVEIFPSFSAGCEDHPELAGKALCGPVAWSPDGTRLIGTEVTGNGLLSLRSDGSGDPRFLDLATNVDLGTGGIVTWQPIGD